MLVAILLSVIYSEAWQQQIVVSLEEVCLDDLTPSAIVVHIPEQDHLDRVMMLSLLHNLVQHPLVVICVLDRCVQRLLTCLQRLIACNKKQIN